MLPERIVDDARAYVRELIAEHGRPAPEGVLSLFRDMTANVTSSDAGVAA